MLDVKNAIKAAMNFFDELFPKNDFKDILLEEVEFSEDRDSWFVTIGFSRRATEETSSYARLTQSEFVRVYKVFEVSAINGSVKSMKVRNQNA